MRARAIVVRQFGGPEVLKVEEALVPLPAKNQVRLLLHNLSHDPSILSSDLAECVIRFRSFSKFNWIPPPLSSSSIPPFFPCRSS